MQVPSGRSTRALDFRKSCASVLIQVCIAHVLLALQGFMLCTHAETPRVDGAAEQILFQDIPVVTGASKYEQRTTEAPSYITIIGSEEISRHGYRTLAEIVNSAPGFYTDYDRTYTYTGNRGFSLPGDYNTRLLVMINGHRVNENIYNSSGFGTDGLIDVDLIERVEIIRGPGSSLYGSNAFLGVINIVTKRGRKYKGPEIAGAAGSYENYKARATYGNLYGSGAELLVSGTYQSVEGKQNIYFNEFDAAETNYGRAENADGDRNGSLFASVSYGDVGIEGGYNKRRKNIPTAPYETVFNDTRTKVWDARAYLDGKYERKLASGLALLVRAGYDAYWYDGDYAYDYPPIVIQKDSADGQWLTGELQLSYRLMERHKIILGCENRYNFQQDQHTYDESPYQQLLDENRESNILAFFLQDEFQILDSLALAGGLRYDHYSTFGGTLNPRIALIYNPWSKTNLKLIYGSAFRAPNVYETYYNDGGLTAKANPDLEPETIASYTAVLEHYFTTSIKGGISAFYYKIEDLIVQVEDPADGLVYFANASSATSKGMDVELEMTIPRLKWKTRAAWSIQKAEDESGRTLVNSPRHIGKLNLTAPFLGEKLFAGLDMNYLGKRSAVDMSDVDPTLVVNLTVSTGKRLFAFWPRLDLSASIYNLFDEEYGSPASPDYRQPVIYHDGRTFFAKAVLSF